MIALSSKGEVADFSEADQMQPAKSQFECGFFACAMAKSMAQVGQAPALSSQQVIVDAELWYAQYDGSDAISNTNGMSLPQLYALLAQIGLHYQGIALDINVVKLWVHAGYPVIIAITETSVRDIALGYNRNPYPWVPSGTHVILITGIASDGNVLARDSANCTDLYNPNSLRPGPRHYDAAALQLVSATVVVPPWQPRPVNATPPIGEEDMLSISNPWVASYFVQTASNPDRWHCAKTNQDLFAGILDGWCLMNGAPRLPKGPEVKCGTQAVYQECESGILLYDPAHELDAPHGPWEPCYLLKLDSPLAKKLLNIGQPAAPVASNTTDTIAQLHAIGVAAAAIGNATATALKDLGA